MFCQNCGTTNPDSGQFCSNCGSPLTAAAAVRPTTGPGAVGGGSFATPPPLDCNPRTSGKAIASLVCGIFTFFFPASIAAIILGHVSLSEIRRSAGRIGGQGLAITGLVLGYLGLMIFPVMIVAAIAIPNLLRARMAANEASAVASVRTLVTAEVTYSSSHPDKGFTCYLGDLSGDGLIDSGLASGTRNGYKFDLLNCSPESAGGANTKFQVGTHPVTQDQTGIRAFCSDESNVIKVDPSGSLQSCLQDGKVL